MCRGRTPPTGGKQNTAGGEQRTGGRLRAVKRNAERGQSNQRSGTRWQDASSCREYRTFTEMDAGSFHRRITRCVSRSDPSSHANIFGIHVANAAQRIEAKSARAINLSGVRVNQSNHPTPIRGDCRGNGVLKPGS